MRRLTDAMLRWTVEAGIFCSSPDAIHTASTAVSSASMVITTSQSNSCSGLVVTVAPRWRKVSAAAADRFHTLKG